MVSRVDPTGAAFSASMRRGFVIMEINRRAVRSLTDYQRLIGDAKPGDVLALLLLRSYSRPANAGDGNGRLDVSASKTS